MGSYRYRFCSFIGGHIQDLMGGGAVVWRSLCIFSILLALLLRSLTLSVGLAPTSQLHSTDSPYAYDNNQCERNWPPETTLLLDQEVH